MNPVSMIGLGIIGIFGVVFFLYNKSHSSLNENESKNKGKSGEKSSSAQSSAKKDEIKKDDVFNFMEFDKIFDGMIVQNKGTKYTMAIKCKGVNYDLMSEVEQLAVEEGFITFLNTLRYPIQLYVQAQNIDLKGAISEYKNNISSITTEYDKVNDEYQKVLESFESSEEDIEKVEKEKSKIENVYEYANDIINYVERLSANKGLLQRSSFVLVSYYTSEMNASSNFSKNEIVDMCHTELLTRAHGIVSALAGCSVEGKILDSNELADLLYNAYNRDDRGLIDVKEALDSGFYRLYSTSKDAFYKREEMLEKQIESQAKLKAYQAIKDSIENGTYVSPKMQALEEEETISRTATEIIKRENVPAEIKKEAQKNIVEEYRQTKRKVLSEISEEKQELLNNTNKEIEKLEPNSNKTKELDKKEIKTEESTKKLEENKQEENVDNKQNLLNNEDNSLKQETNTLTDEILNEESDGRGFEDDSEDDSII